MAKITSKADLAVGTNLTIDEPGRIITLNVGGALVAKDGVTLQALYSKLVDLWATSTYQDSPFPMYAIDALSGQFQIGTDGATYSGWKFSDVDSNATRNMLRDGGWSEYSAAGVLNQQYAGFIGLGTITPATTCQPYYHLASTDAPIDFPFTDQFNVGVRVYGDASHGSLDKRTYAKAFAREYGKKFKSSVLADTGATATGANKQNFLVSNEDDLKITGLLGAVQATGDAAMSGAPYSGITVAYYTRQPDAHHCRRLAQLQDHHRRQRRHAGADLCQGAVHAAPEQRHQHRRHGGHQDRQDPGRAAQVRRRHAGHEPVGLYRRCAVGRLQPRRVLRRQQHPARQQLQRGGHAQFQQRAGRRRLQLPPDVHAPHRAATTTARPRPSPSTTRWAARSPAPSARRRSRSTSTGTATPRAATPAAPRAPSR